MFNASTHLQRFLGKMSAKATDYVFALATLVYATQIGSFLFVSHRPRWPRHTVVTFACYCHWHYFNISYPGSWLGINASTWMPQLNDKQSFNKSYLLCDINDLMIWYSMVTYVTLSSQAVAPISFFGLFDFLHYSWFVDDD